MADGRHVRRCDRSGAARAATAAQRVAVPHQNCGACLRRGGLGSGRWMAHGGDRARSGHTTNACPRCHPGRRLCRPLVGQPPAPGQGPPGTDPRVVAGDRPGRRAGRFAGHVGDGGPVGLAGPAPPGPRSDHPRRDRQDPGHRVRPRHLPGRRPRLPDTRQLRQPVRAARARHRPARRRDPVARTVGHLDHRAHRAGAVRGRGPVPGLVPAPPRPVRRGDRRGQERRAQRADREPVRLPRRGAVGHRPQEGHGARSVAPLSGPAGDHSRRRQRRSWRMRSRCSKHERQRSPSRAGGSGSRHRKCPR